MRREAEYTKVGVSSSVFTFAVYLGVATFGSPGILFGPVLVCGSKGFFTAFSAPLVAVGATAIAEVAVAEVAVGATGGRAEAAAVAEELVRAALTSAGQQLAATTTGRVTAPIGAEKELSAPPPVDRYKTP